MDKKTPAPFEYNADAVTSIQREDDSPKKGQWYWVLRDDDDAPDYVEWLGCIMKEFSNAVEIWSPKSANGYNSQRVHRDDFSKLLRFEPNADRVIRARIAHYKDRIDQALAAIESDKASLGLVELGKDSSAQSESNAVAVISGTVDVKAYEASLIALKERLPVAKEQLKKLTIEWARWVNAETLPMEGVRDSMDDSISEIDNRIFNVSLYAGLTEGTVQFATGAPASIDEKLHLMQRRLYMDEECLLGYSTGGIDIENSDEFRAWLAIPENRDRILPFPRCIVSMQIRREEKERDWKGSFKLLRRNSIMGMLDKSTYLFIRNGENLHQLECSLDFGELIFPEKAAFDNSEPLMFKHSHGRGKETMTRREYDARVKDREEKRVKRKQWFADNPQKEWEALNPNKSWDYHNPYNDHDHSFSASAWHPFDQSSVYYDDGLKNIQDQIKQYNRIALIVQGLFDRKEILAPSHPLKSWDPVSFARSIELVYDANGLYHGDVPDFEAYIEECNKTITEGSVLVGQDDFWARKEADKDYQHFLRNRRSSNEQAHRPSHLRPFGDPGPGLVAVPDRIAGKKATFMWFREGRDYNMVKAKIAVPFDKLFNVSAYKPGDFIQFFKDPRTRHLYLKWAPMLLAAEDYYAGKLKAQMPGHMDAKANY